MGTHDLDPAIGKAGAPRGVVHESEAQRQHARVRIPGHIEVPATGGGTPLRFPLEDLSAGGASFRVNQAQAAQLKPGSQSRAQVAVTVDGIAIHVPVSLKVLHSDAANGRVSVQFNDLGAKEVSALRHLISSFLAGEIVGVGEMVHTLGRENFIKARGPASSVQSMGLFGRARAVALTALMFLVGVASISYMLAKAQHAVLVADAEAAKVAGTVFTLTMPREGSFFSLVPADGLVKKGAPIASFEASALDLVKSQATGASLSVEQIDKLLAQTVKGTITSPCDCRVQSVFVADNQYVSRGASLMELTPLQGTPHVLARFSYAEAERLRQGAIVQFKVSGDGRVRDGEISQVRVTGGSEAVDSDLLVTIVPREPLPIDLVNRPVRASVGQGMALPDLMPAAMAMWGGKP